MFDSSWSYTTFHNRLAVLRCLKLPLRGRAKDNIWIERFWRTIKYDYIYIQPEENVSALYQGILRFTDDYNYLRHHQGIDRQIPSKLYLRSAA